MFLNTKIMVTINLAENVDYSNNSTENNGLIRVSKNNPCRHCGKPDWCYQIGELEVCKRGESAKGWRKTSKMDDEGSC